MRRFAARVSALVLIAAAAALATPGCGDEPDGAAAAAGDTPPATGPAAGGGSGTVRGTVSLVGRPPEMKVIANKPCHPGAAPIVEETVVAGPDGRLANVVVFLREAPASAETLPPAELGQVNCRFAPHVLALKTGQVLRVTSSDPTLHNVHTLSSRNPSLNMGFVEGAPAREVTFAEPEAFTVRCDVHHWMNANVHVFDHRHFAVTDAAGGFELAGVPAGRYTLVFRHELFGDVEQVVDVAAGAVVEATAAYARPR
jgi:plastocyanin